MVGCSKAGWFGREAWQRRSSSQHGRQEEESREEKKEGDESFQAVLLVTFFLQTGFPTQITFSGKLIVRQSH